MADHTREFKEENMRQHFSRVSADLNRLRNEWGITLILCHQMSTEYVKRGPSAKPHHSFAKDLGITFAALMDVVIAIGNHDDETKITWIAGSKVRSEAGGSRLVRLDGANSRFMSVSQDDYTVDKKGRFVRADQDGVLETPEESVHRTNRVSVSELSRYQGDGDDDQTVEP